MVPLCDLPSPPPYTSVPDYVWADVRDCSLQFVRIPRKPREKPVPQIPHPDAKSALEAAKRACYKHPGRWYGRASNQADGTSFLVYEGGKVIERHVVGR